MPKKHILMHSLHMSTDLSGNYQITIQIVLKEYQELKCCLPAPVIVNYPSNTEISESRYKRRESDVWQRRFWEHLIKLVQQLIFKTIIYSNYSLPTLHTLH